MGNGSLTEVDLNQKRIRLALAYIEAEANFNAALDKDWKAASNGVIIIRIDWPFERFERLMAQLRNDLILSMAQTIDTNNFIVQGLLDYNSVKAADELIISLKKLGVTST